MDIFRWKGSKCTFTQCKILRNVLNIRSFFAAHFALDPGAKYEDFSK
jgi:hypothetical protein